MWYNIREYEIGECLFKQGVIDMTKKITSAILALAMLLMTACGADSMNDTSKTENSSAADTTTTTVVTESNNDWTPSLIASAPADTSKKEEKNTTKTEDKNSKTDNKEGATTTTKSASNDSKQEQPQGQQKPQSTQAQPRTTQGIPKATVKPVQTTKATTKATQKQAQAQVSVPSNLSAYQKSIYNMVVGKATKSDYETVRNEFLAYGKKKYPQFKINTKIHPFVDANGNYTDDAYKMKDYADSVEFYHVEEFGAWYGYKSDAERMEAVNWFDQLMKRDIDNLLENQKRYEAGDGVVWYVTYGTKQGENNQLATWVAVASFDNEWK